MRVLPKKQEMLRAFQGRDSSYDGVFYVAVNTTGIFCRPSCSARKPVERNVEFFPNAAGAMAAGYRACKRCKPLSIHNQMPGWMHALMDKVDQEPGLRIRDADIRDMGLEPVRVRRYFQSNFGMTFQAYHRARRLGLAWQKIRNGDDLLGVALQHGFESPSGFRDAYQRTFGESPPRNPAQDCGWISWIPSPLGPLMAVACDSGLCLLEFLDRKALKTQLQKVHRWLKRPLLPGNHAFIESLKVELSDYFQGTLQEFQTPLAIHGTDFQMQVWDSLLKIPYGKTTSYARLAQKIGRPGAQRAVGAANGANRLAVLIPCHRVVQADGGLRGYGGGLWRKQFLLDLEQGVLQQTSVAGAT